MFAGSKSSRARRATIAAIVASSALLGACATPPPSELAFVALAPDLIDPKILRQEVEGEWCFTQDFITVSLRPPWRVRLADVSPAVTRAIESVPGANVLTNITLQTRVEQYLFFQRTCSVVIGDAGRLE